MAEVYITSFVLPNYIDYKKDVHEYQNSSNCFPDDLITLAGFSICEENQEWKVTPKKTCLYQHLLKKVSYHPKHFFVFLTGWWRFRPHLWEYIFFRIYVGVQLGRPTLYHGHGRFFRSYSFLSYGLFAEISMTSNWKQLPDHFDPARPRTEVFWWELETDVHFLKRPRTLYNDTCDSS